MLVSLVFGYRPTTEADGVSLRAGTSTTVTREEGEYLLYQRSLISPFDSWAEELSRDEWVVVIPGQVTVTAPGRRSVPVVEPSRSDSITTDSSQVYDPAGRFEIPSEGRYTIRTPPAAPTELLIKPTGAWFAFSGPAAAVFAGALLLALAGYGLVTLGRWIWLGSRGPAQQVS